MKHRTLLIIIAIFMSISVFGQAKVFKSSWVSVASRNFTTGYYNWGDWEKAEVKMVYDATEGSIEIFSDMPQKYDLLTYTEGVTNSNRKTIKYKAIDNEGIKCNVDFIIQDNGEFQLYIFYNDVAWAYQY